MSLPNHLSSIRSIGLALVGSIVMVVAMATMAFAQSVYPPAASLAVACTPESPQPDGSVTCMISGAPADTDLDVNVASGSEVLLDTTVTTDGDGQADFSFTAPNQAGAEITVTISGEEIDGTLVLGVTVAAAADAEVVEVVEDDEDLARTGGEFSTLLLLGLGLGVAGIGAVALGRRRENARVDA